MADTLVAASRGRQAAQAQGDAVQEAIDVVTFRLLPLIEEALDRVAASFTDLVADGEPIDQTDTARIVDMWAAEIPSLASVMAQVYVGTTNVALRQLGSARSATEALREAYLATATNRLTDVGQSLWAESASALTEGVRAGEGYGALRERLRTTFAEGGSVLGESRAMRIARTEVQSAVNHGTQDAVMALDDDRRPRYKAWLATLGPQTREAHAEADGQTVPIDQPFEVDGELLEYPGDPAGSPGNIINCRCTVVYTDDPNGFDTQGTRQLGYKVDPCGGSKPREAIAAADEFFEAGEEIDDYIDPADADEAAWCALLDDPLMQSTGQELSFANDPNASAAWVEENYSQWAATLTNAEIGQLKYYTEDGFSDLNRALRATEGTVDLDVHSATTSALDDMLSRTSAPDDIVVFRQLTDYSGDGFWGSLRVDDEFIDNAYVSSSLSNTDVFGMTGSRVTTNVRITVPKGSQGMPVAQLGGKTGSDLTLALREDEFILPRGTKFRVKSVASDGSLDLEIIT